MLGIQLTMLMIIFVFMSPCPNSLVVSLPRRKYGGNPTTARYGKGAPPVIDDEKYFEEGRDEGRNEGRNEGRRRQQEEQRESELVLQYTKKVHTKFLVALSAAMGSFCLSIFLSNMIFSKSILVINASVALGGLLLTFMKGHAADFFRALGKKI